MVIDVHCHVGLSARRADPSIPRFSFEPDGARGTPGYDSYLSPRLLKRPAWFFIRRWLGIDAKLGRGDELDVQIEAVNHCHWSQTPSVDRLVLLAFDEYHDDSGRAIGVVERGRAMGSDLYASNSFVRAICAAAPPAQPVSSPLRGRFLLGGSIHPYRTHGEHSACDLLEELATAGAVLVKWLPVHQNIGADDPRTVEFLRTAARLGVPMLIHYGGEMSLTPQHKEYEDPRPLLGVLRGLRAEGAMPTVIVAHVATPSFRWQSEHGFEALASALVGEFRDAPLYADISALAAFGRTLWLRRIADMPELHDKLVWGSDFPVPLMLRSFRRVLGRRARRDIAALPSWIEQDIRLKRAVGYPEGVFTRAAQILGVG